MNNIALPSYDKTDFLWIFLKQTRFIYRFFAYIIDMATILCSQDQKSFLLSLTLMKKLTVCFHPYKFSVLLMSNTYDF